MGTKINRTVVVNGEKKWIHANTEQEYAEKLLKLYDAGKNVVSSKVSSKAQHNFSEYAKKWFDIYSKPTVETATAVTYERQLRLYLLPAFEGMALEDIGADEIQSLFTEMSGAKSTKDKARMVLNMIFESAVEDGIVQVNPLKSRKIKIHGRESEFTKEYTVEQMRFLISHLDDIRKTSDRMFLALMALHPFRLEEVLGLKWVDVEIVARAVYIRRAVTHPTRNQPEIKETKTKASRRIIGLSEIAIRYLEPGRPDEFIFGGEKPLTYTQVRRMCERIQRDTGFGESITPIRFRTTVLTDIYDQLKDVKAAQAAAGHTTSAMTLKHYVKGRETSRRTIDAIDKIYGA